MKNRDCHICHGAPELIPLCSAGCGLPTREQISRYLTEKVLGERWHPYINGSHQAYREQIDNIFKPWSIFALIKVGQEKDWWEEFEGELILQWCGDDPTINWPNLFNLPEVMYNFLKERE